MNLRSPLATLAALGALTTVGCAGHPRENLAPTEGGPVAVYRVTLSSEAAEALRFRVRLFASAPDRLHAEVLAPAGPPPLSLDAGAGRIAVVRSGDPAAYVGPADAASLSSLFGLESSVEALVRALVLGEDEPDDPLRIVGRTPGGAGLPRRLIAECGGRRLTMIRAGGVRRVGLGAGTGSGDFWRGRPQRPLSDLELEARGGRRGGSGEEAP